MRGRISNALGYTMRVWRRMHSTSGLGQAHVQALRTVVGEEGIVHESEALEPYNVDWLKKYRGRSTLVVRPKNTQEVSQVLSYCKNKGLKVCGTV
jgi:hypothetical protein